MEATPRPIEKVCQSSKPAFNPRRAPKSRNGCLRCKAKRLKCDETKPGCQQCVRKNAICPGYKSKALVWSTKHEKMLTPGQEAPFPAPSDILVTNLTEAISGNHHESLGTETPKPEENNIPNPDDYCPTPANTQPSPPPLTTPTQDPNPPTDSLSAIRQQLDRSTVPSFLLHLPTMLVEYYFSYVCQIFSSFDGTLNPFRSTIARLWDGSAPIYYAIQSMAAAYLANHFPRMLPVGIQMQRETYRCLYQLPHGGSSKPASENLDKTLLTVLLVGQTTAWHDPKDLGLVHLKTAKRLNRKRLEQQLQHEQISGTEISTRSRRQNEFFEQCILYWDMLAGFVDDDIDEFGFGQFELSSPPPARSQSSSSSPNTNPTTSPTTPPDPLHQIFPHPWTGVAPHIQTLFARTGRLIRSYRKSLAQDTASINLLSLDLGFDISFPHDSLSTIEANNKSALLEEELLGVELPGLGTLVDAGDERTPVGQYLVLAEAYRCAGLLEIYRVFGGVLERRLGVGFAGGVDGVGEGGRQRLVDVLGVDIEVLEGMGGHEGFLVGLAMHTIALLEKLPATSGTRCLQPIVLIVAASELRYPSTNLPVFPITASGNTGVGGFGAIGEHLPAYQTASSSIFNSLTGREVDIAEKRRFVMTRFQEYQLSLPAKPLIRAEMLVRETWRRSDEGVGEMGGGVGGGIGGQGVFWVDVMDEMGWGTIYG